MKPLTVAALLLSSACSQHLYAPPTQAYALDPVHAQASGTSSLDVEGSTHSQIFDPAFNAANARLHTGIGNDAELSLESMFAGVDAHGVSMADRHVYAGRAGFRFNPGHGPLTFSTGIGGGYAPAGGGFTAIDGGVSLGYDNCVLVPIASASTFVSQPIDARRVDVTDDPNAGPTYSIAHRTLGGTIRTGLRLSLSPSECRAGHQVPWLTAGFDVTTLVDATSDAELFGVGAGITIPL